MELHVHKISKPTKLIYDVRSVASAFWELGEVKKHIVFLDQGFGYMGMFTEIHAYIYYILCDFIIL